MIISIVHQCIQTNKMASSSRLSSIVELNSVEIKSETLVSSTDPTEHLKCLYNYLFHDVQPSNEQKLRVNTSILLIISHNLISFRY